MVLLGIIALVVLLYARTLTYSYLIDDNVKRNGYMFEVPLTAPPVDFYKTKPSKLYRCFMIAMHCVNVSIIYMLWGWCPALLFAVHPQCVWGVAWVTGNYYATTAYFSLIAFFILHTFPNIWGALVAMPIFAAALNSTICCVSFPFIYLFVGNPWGLSLFVPLYIYLTGKRFQTGIKIRDSFKEGKPLQTPFTYKRFFLCTKVMARYLIDCFYPRTLGLFTPYGHTILDKKEIYDRWESPNAHFWASLFIVGATAIAGAFINWTGIVWFLVVLALHSQWRLTGQFYAQRYLYLAIIGFCVCLGQGLQSYPILATVVATFFFIRAWVFVPAFKNMENMYKNDLAMFPDFPQAHNNLGQYFINTDTSTASRVNHIGYLFFKAEETAPDDWSIKMNVACFFALIGQWGICHQKTTESLSLVRPLGGPQHPVKMLEQQLLNVEAKIAEIKAQIAQEQGGAILSPPQTPGIPVESGKENG